MKHEKFHLISLGCAKNLVDSTSLANIFASRKLEETDQIQKAKYILINTCGFIHDAREESFETIREAAALKKPGQKLIVTGCLSERYKEALFDQVDGIDGLMGTRNLADLTKLIDALDKEPDRQQCLFPGYQHLINNSNLPGFAIQGNSAYLKLGDGCRRSCAYCAIPHIKGPLVSRPKEDIFHDALELQDLGIQEINLIAQDTTDYGRDLAGHPVFTELLDELLPQIKDVPWVRVLYAFPGFDVTGLITAMKMHPNLLHYLDLPLQHASPKVLQDMLRPHDIDWVKNAIAQMRAEIPDLVLRTTLIVGFPTETEEDFNTLIEFVREIQFDRLGVFTYSPEDGTPAFKLGDPIPEEVKLSRQEAVMNLQGKIMVKKQRSLIGKNFDLLVEGNDESQKIVVGRTWRDAPEVDGLVISTGTAPQNGFFKAKITGVNGPDLYAEPAE